MIAIIASWGIISFLCFTFGDLLILIYNKICRKSERYNFMDIAIFGLSFITILISISSIWLPTDQYILFFLVLLSTLYWIIKREQAKYYFTSLKESLAILKVKDYFFISLVIISILTYV